MLIESKIAFQASIISKAPFFKQTDSLLEIYEEQINNQDKAIVTQLNSIAAESNTLFMLLIPQRQIKSLNNQDLE